MIRQRKHLVALAVGAVLVALPVSAATAVPAIAADPCRDRPPTVLDRLPDWRCVGLATFTDPAASPVERTLTEDEARRLDVTRPGSYELGVAVSPDGRLYRQTVLPPAGPLESRPHNPTPPDVDPEGEPRPTGSMGVETIFGPDDRVLRLATTSYPWRAMGSILAPGGATTSNCSGSLIGPRHFITAGHCIHQGGGGKGQGWFPNRKVAPGQRGIGVFPNGVKNHSWYFSVSGWFDDADPAYDYAMIVLEDRNDTAHLGWLGWRSSGHTGDHWTFGYPGWFFGCAASPSADGLCNNHLYGDDSSPPFVFSKQIPTTADINSGQSGSPLYKYNGGDRRVIGIIAYHGNWATRVTGTRSTNFCNWIHAFPSAFNNHGCQ